MESITVENAFQIVSGGFFTGLALGIPVFIIRFFRGANRVIIDT